MSNWKEYIGSSSSILDYYLEPELQFTLHNIFIIIVIKLQ